MNGGTTFAYWLRQRRKARDLTQEELADRIGSSPETIRKIEAGRRRPSKQMAEVLAEYLGVPLEDRQEFVHFARVDAGGVEDKLSDSDASAPSHGSGAASAFSRRALSHLNANLPVPPTPLVGREREVEAAQARLLSDRVRLLTMVGLPGVGKTRLALEVAAGLIDHFEQGVFFVELAPIRTPEVIIPTIAKALGLKETANQPLEEDLKSYLADKQALLVLDNFEQVVEGAPYVAGLLVACPWLKVLATSRIALQLRGEKQFVVPPLDLPPDPRTDGTLRSARGQALEPFAALNGGRWNVEMLERYSAVALFIERVQDIESDFKLTKENAEAVASICLRLDGLPLAIELVAARIATLTPQQMLARLDSRFALAASQFRDLPARQQTLRSAIDWSYDLLSDGEKQLFRRMAVFQGGRTPPALEEVCNYDGQLQMDVLDGARSLLGKNLLQQREGSDGGPRFWMLETIHEYAREKLGESKEGEECKELEREHALYFMRLAEEAEPHLTGAKRGEWLTTLDQEHDNLRAALRWAREGGEQTEKNEVGLRIAGAIWRFWDVKGHFSEGREYLGGLLALPGSVVPVGSEGLSGSPKERTVQVQITLRAYRARALAGAGNLAHKQGDYSTARSLHEESLAIMREIGDKRGIAYSLHNLGVVALEYGDYSTTRSLHEESLAIRREIVDKGGIAASLNSLGNLAAEQGDNATARSLHEESLAIRREIGDKGGISASRINLGIVAAEQGDLSTARSLYEESLALDRELGDKRGIAYSVNYLGVVAHKQGDYSTARSLYEESLTIRKETGDKRGVAVSLAGLGEVAMGATAVAVAGSRGGVDVERGARVLGAVEALLENIGTVLDREDRLPYEQAVASARSQLGEKGFQRAWQEGRGMSMEQAIVYALKNTEQESVSGRQTPRSPQPLSLPLE